MPLIVRLGSFFFFFFFHPLLFQFLVSYHHHWKSYSENSVASRPVGPVPFSFLFFGTALGRPDMSGQC